MLYFRLRWFVFTGSYRSTLLIATRTTTPSLVKTSLTNDYDDAKPAISRYKENFTLGGVFMVIRWSEVQFSLY